jgi:hypothetical protein
MAMHTLVCYGLRWLVLAMNTLMHTPLGALAAMALALSSSPSFPFSLLSLGSSAQRVATKWQRVMVDC